MNGLGRSMNRVALGSGSGQYPRTRRMFGNPGECCRKRPRLRAGGSSGGDD
jgi:hypothetical protein